MLLVVGSAAGVYWYAGESTNQGEVSQWLDRSLDDVASMHVEVADGTYTLRKIEGERRWEVDVPGLSWNVTTRGVRGKIDYFFSRLSELTPYNSIIGVNPENLGEYGLDAPVLKMILQFNSDQKKTLTIRFAKDENGKIWGWNSDNPQLIYEFDDGVLEQFAYPAPYFFDTRLFAFEEGSVTQVQLVQPFGSSWVVEKGKSGYTFNLPGYLKGKDAADSEIELYVHTLILLHASKLVLAPVTPEKDMAALTIKVTSGASAEPAMVEFFTIKDNPGFYLGKSSWLPVPFMLDAESVSQLVRSAFDVQNRTVLSLDIGEVDSFVVDHGENRYIIERDDTGWRVRGGEKNLPGIDMSLWRYTELEFEALPLNNLSTTAVKLMQCQFMDADGKVLESSVFYVDPELPKGQCWMKSGDGMFYPVSSRLLKDLQGMFPSGSKLTQ